MKILYESKKTSITIIFDKIFRHAYSPFVSARQTRSWRGRGWRGEGRTAGGEAEGAKRRGRSTCRTEVARGAEPHRAKWFKTRPDLQDLCPCPIPPRLKMSRLYWKINSQVFYPQCSRQGERWSLFNKLIKFQTLIRDTFKNDKQK